MPMITNLRCRELCHNGVREAHAAHILTAVAAVFTVIAAVIVITRAEGHVESVQLGKVCTTIDRTATMAEEVSMAEEITEADEDCTRPGTSMPVDSIS